MYGWCLVQKLNHQEILSTYPKVTHSSKGNDDGQNQIDLQIVLLLPLLWWDDDDGEGGGGGGGGGGGSASINWIREKL